MNKEERESKENINRIAPFIGQAHSLGKQSRHDEAYNAVRPFLEQGEMPSFFYPTVGWTIYHYLKDHADTMPSAQVSALFRQYFDICPHEPAMVHSFIMVLAANYEKKHPQDFNFLAFCREWHLDTFREEDYQSKKSQTADGRPIVFQSLAVNVATRLYKELKSSRSPKLAKELLPFFETIRQKCPDYEFSTLYIANLQAWQGNAAEAIAQFKQMLCTNQQWYLWLQLGDLLTLQLKLACYCKALSMDAPENYLTEAHITLAQMLADTDKSQAAYELSAYMSTYRKNNWRIKGDAYILENSLKGVVPNDKPKQFYALHAAKAEEFAFAEYPSTVLIFTQRTQNKQGKPLAQLENHERHLFIKVPFSSEFKRTVPGAAFKCRLRRKKHITTVLTIHRYPEADKQRSLPEQPAAPQKVEGTVSRTEGKPFAFLNRRYYIPPYLVEQHNLINGQHITAEVILQTDGRQRVSKIISK